MTSEKIDNEGLKREIGVWGLVANSINIIVGAGIFILPVIIAERLGTASIWAYLIVLQKLEQRSPAQAVRIHILKKLLENMQDFLQQTSSFLVQQ